MGRCNDMKGKLLECRITLIEDLRDDIKDGAQFGSCIEENCTEDVTHGTLVQIDGMTFNILLCVQHLSQLHKMFKYKQTAVTNFAVPYPCDCTKKKDGE